MPCWTVQTMSVEFHAKNRKLLEAALDALGWHYLETSPGVLAIDRGNIILDLERGQASLTRDSQRMLNSLKQEYSRQALRRAAKLQGWQLKKTTQLKGVLRR